MLALPPLFGAVALGPLAASGGADTSLLGYNASALAIGAQFAFNVPGVVPLPNENLIEDDVPFARVNWAAVRSSTPSGRPTTPATSRPAWARSSDVRRTRAPAERPAARREQVPDLTGLPRQRDLPPGTRPGNCRSPRAPPRRSTGGGTASGTVTNLSLANLLNLSKLPVIGGILSSTSGSPIDVGNISSTNNVVVGSSSITSTATSTLGAIDIAGLVDIAGLTSTAVGEVRRDDGDADGTVHLGTVTVDGRRPTSTATGCTSPRTQPAGRHHAGAAPADRRRHAGPGRREHPRCSIPS